VTGTGTDAAPVARRPVTGGWSGEAEQTARRVLAWAAAPSGAPPVGGLRGVGSLASDTRAQEAFRSLARQSVARLGAGRPPLGDPGPVGPGGLFLAAAIGARALVRPARQLTVLVPPPPLGPRAPEGSWADALARHAVVAPVLGVDLARAPVVASPASPVDPAVEIAGARDQDAAAGQTVGDAPADEEPLAEALLRASPLTTVLYRPAAGRREQALDAALALLARPQGARVLAAAIARWTPDPLVMRWRESLLAALSGEHWAAVVAVYGAARLCHGEDWDRRLTAAAGALDAPGERRPDELTLATIGFWGALRAHGVRGHLERHGLITGHERARALVARHLVENRQHAGRQGA
jgi:hypothetical protein